MPYTLSMALLWVVLAVVLGIVIGWLMRSVVAKRQIERARTNHVDNVELDRLRGRVANLEPALAERDRLRAELAACRAAGLAGTPDAARFAPVDLGTDAEPVDAAADGGVSEAAEAAPAAVVEAPAVGPEDTASADAPPAGAPDVAAAAAVLGRKIRLDDLTVVEGIGPKIGELCRGIGISTWADLAQTEVSLLRTMLHDAGPRFRSHDPASWPEQAALLAAGRWDDFVALTERLDGGDVVD